MSVWMAQQVHAATNDENSGDRHVFLLGDFSYREEQTLTVFIPASASARVL